jgi:ribosome-associated protein
VTELQVEGSIELQDVLKKLALVPSGGAAKRAIQAGEVLVNGAVETHRARRLSAGDEVQFAGHRVLLVR